MHWGITSKFSRDGNHFPLVCAAIQNSEKFVIITQVLPSLYRTAGPNITVHQRSHDPRCISQTRV